jgi:hypothetical protein
LTPNNVRDLLQTRTYVGLKKVIRRFVAASLRLRVAQLLLGVSDTFRISETHVRRQRRVFVLLFLVVVVLLAGQFWRSGTEDVWSSALAAIVVVAITCFCFVRVHRHTVAFAATHALLLTDDAILFRNGGTERRVPYSAIEWLKVRRPYFGGEPSFSLKCLGLSEDRFYGYERMDTLLSTLIDKLPRDRVKGHRAHA